MLTFNLGIIVTVAGAVILAALLVKLETRDKKRTK